MITLKTIKQESPYYQEVILYYKVNACPNPHSHKQNMYNLANNSEQQQCFHYHNNEERRRPVFSEKTLILVYKPAWCPILKNGGKCKDDETCIYSHTQNEIDYHPLYYKTISCL